MSRLTVESASRPRKQSLELSRCRDDCAVASMIHFEAITFEERKSPLFALVDLRRSEGIVIAAGGGIDQAQKPLGP